jgi:hypothetical protein
MHQPICQMKGSHYVADTGTAIQILDGKIFNGLSLAVAAAGCLFAYLGYLWTRRKVRLRIVSLPAAPLISHPSEKVTGVAVTVNGCMLADPHIVTLTLRSEGIRSINSAHFDQGRPIVLTLSVPIVELLSAESDGAPYRCNIKGAELHIGPDLLKCDKPLVIQLLTDGKPSLSRSMLKEYYLIDVKVSFENELSEEEKRQKEERQKRRFRISVAATLATVAIICGIRIQISPESGIAVSSKSTKPGSDIVISGHGFHANELQRLYVFGREFDAKTNSDGSLNLRQSVPLGTLPGRYWIGVRGGGGIILQSAFLVVQ